MQIKQTQDCTKDTKSLMQMQYSRITFRSTLWMAS